MLDDTQIEKLADDLIDSINLAAHLKILRVGKRNTATCLDASPSAAARRFR